MASHAQDWIVAASCCEGPRPTATFADMPRKHKSELLRFAFVAALSATFFATLAILARPIPSRSFAANVALPNPVLPRPELRQATLVASIDAPSPRPLRTHSLRTRPSHARAGFQVASLREAPADDVKAGYIPVTQERRSNVFSRFFRTVFRGTPSAVARTDEP